jgi:nucleoside diphosphate kinase
MENYGGEIQFDELNDAPFGLMILKPNGIYIQEQIVAMLKFNGLRIVLKKPVRLDAARINDHYKFIPERYFRSITEYLKGRETILLILQAQNYLGLSTIQDMVDYLRMLTGKSCPAVADRGTVRRLGNDLGVPSYIIYMNEVGEYDWCIDNFVHTSGSPTDLLRECEIWLDERTEYCQLKQIFFNHLSEN